jgi:uncharacterized protein
VTYRTITTDTWRSQSEKDGADLRRYERDIRVTRSRRSVSRLGTRPFGAPQAEQSRVEPILSNFVVAESHALLLVRLGPAIARKWLLNNIWRIERVSEADETKAREIIDGYSDKGFSYTDATSFALMERLRVRRALAFDKHFRQYGFQTE